MKVTISFILFPFSLLLSCHNISNPQEQKLDTLIENTKKLIRNISDTANKDHPYDVIKVSLNKDTITDYFVIDRIGISSGTFYDGKTGNEIPTDGVNVPWSRPGIELDYKIIDVLCGDSQKEILIKMGSGGTAGLNLTTEIYRFDSAQNFMKLIFSEDEFSSHADENFNDIVDETNYISLRYKKDRCNMYIYTCSGFYKGKAIVPVKNSKSKIYYFDELKNIFEPTQ